MKGNRMKSLTSKFLVVIAAGVFAVSATSVFGQVGQLINLDEMGNGFITPDQPFAHANVQEPLSAIATLRYDLPFVGIAGDVLLQESPGGPISDILRFDGASHVYFFSDGSDGIDSLADVAQLPNPITPNRTFLEQGQEGGLQYVFYTPLSASDPGFKSAAPGTTYYVISDVPEPSVTMMLGCMGGGLLLLQTMRRQAKRE
jgi:hypothetical protein